MRNPMAPPPGASVLGSAALAAPDSKRWELGEVTEYNPGTHTSSVRTHTGKPLQNVPQLKPAGGTYESFSVGTTVAVSWDLGFPVIVGVLEDAGAAQTAVPPVSLTGTSGFGVEDGSLQTNGTNTYRPARAPLDMGPGDWAHVGRLGNHVAVLEGGLTLLGSPSAQVRSMGASGVLQTVARRTQQVTDFGIAEVRNDAGKTSYVLRAGANQATETGADEQHWTLQLDLGATGDLVDFKVSEPEGRVLFRLHVGADGRVQLFGDGGVDITSGKSGAGEARVEDTGDAVRQITGGLTEDVGGDTTRTTQGSKTETVGGDYTRAVVGDATTYCAGDELAIVTGQRQAVITGDDVCTTEGDKVEIVKQDTDCVTRGDARIAADGGLALISKSTAKLTGQHVILGDDGNHPLPKWDVFLSDFSAFVGDVLGAVKTLAAIDPITIPPIVVKLTAYKAKLVAGGKYKSSKVKND